MLWNNHVQSSTNDWTPIYNARNYPTLTEDNKHKNRWSRGRKALAAGLRRGKPGHTGPMFNPLHPTVQEAIIGFVREIGQRYGSTPRSRHLVQHLRLGHAVVRLDPFRIRRLHGRPVPEGDRHGRAVDAKAPDRFSKRYEF